MGKRSVRRVTALRGSAHLILAVCVLILVHVSARADDCGDTYTCSDVAYW